MNRRVYSKPLHVLLFNVRIAGLGGENVLLGPDPAIDTHGHSTSTYNLINVSFNFQLVLRTYSLGIVNTMMTGKSVLAAAYGDVKPRFEGLLQCM